MTGTGRFDTTTTTKIKTKHGTVLKVATYEEDCTRPDIEYKIRGTCKYCGDKLECWCFTEDNFEDPLQEAIDCLSTGFICDKPRCVIESEKENDPEQLKILQANYEDDEYAIRDAIWETWGECEDGPEECGI